MAEHISNSKPVILPQLVTHTLKAVIEWRRRGGRLAVRWFLTNLLYTHDWANESNYEQLKVTANCSLSCLSDTTNVKLVFAASRVYDGFATLDEDGCHGGWHRSHRGSKSWIIIETGYQIQRWSLFSWIVIIAHLLHEPNMFSSFLLR